MAPARKRQKLSSSQPAEIVFDPAARNDYLTGFHKRKLARAEHARELAAQKAREEKIEERRQLREQKKQDIELHVKAINLEFRKLNPDISSEDEAEDDDRNDDGQADAKMLNEEEEFVDEDKYTSVTVEPMLQGEDEEDEQAGRSNIAADQENVPASTSAKVRPKKKKKKFRYESKIDRKENRMKLKAKNRKAALARKGEKT